MDNEWPFDQAKNVAAVTTVNIVEKISPILIVTHYLDDHSWGFFCGLTNKTKDCKLVSMVTIFEIDKSIIEIADLPPGWTATRKDINSEWERIKEE